MLSLISRGVGLPVTASAIVAVSFASLPTASIVPVYHSMPVLPSSMYVATYFFETLSNPA